MLIKNNLPYLYQEQQNNKGSAESIFMIRIMLKLYYH